MNGLFVGKINLQGEKLAGKTAKGKASVLGGLSCKTNFADIFSKKIKKTKESKVDFSNLTVSLGENLTTVKKSKKETVKTEKKVTNTVTKNKTSDKHQQFIKLSTRSSKKLTGHIKSLSVNKNSGKTKGTKEKTNISVNPIKQKPTGNIKNKEQVGLISKNHIKKQKNNKATKLTVTKKTEPNLKVKNLFEKNIETQTTDKTASNIKSEKSISRIINNFKPEFSNDTVKVKLFTLKKDETNLEEQVNKLIEKLDLKQNQQRIENQLKGELSSEKQSAVMEKLMEALKTAQKQKPTHRAVLELEPKSLGKIEVKLSYSADHKIDIQVKADNPAVKAMVESSFSSLSSFVGSNNSGNFKQNNNNNVFAFENIDLSPEEQMQIIENILASSDNGEINIIV
jgi:hypothetical protein